MLHKHRGWWAFAVLVGAVLPALFAEAPTASPPSARPEPEAKKLDLLKLPPDAVLISRATESCSPTIRFTANALLNGLANAKTFTNSSSRSGSAHQKRRQSDCS